MAKKIGRPKREIDLALVESLGEIQCTYAECAAILDIPEGTLKKRPDFTTAHKKGMESGKRSLRRTQFKLAQTNATMAIWLGKQYLGQSDYVLPQGGDTDKTAAELFQEMAKSTPTLYAVPIVNGVNKVQDSSSGAKKRQNGTGKAVHGDNGDDGAKAV